MKSLVFTLSLGSMLAITGAANAEIFYTQPALDSNLAPAPPTTLFSANEDGTGFAAVGGIKLGSTDIAASAIAVDPDGNLMGFQFTPAQGSRPISIDRTTGEATLIGAGSFVPEHLTGAGFDRDGNLWVLDITNKVVQQYDLGTLGLVGAGIPIPSPSITNGGDIAFDLDGRCLFQGTHTTIGTGLPLYECDLDAGTFSSLGQLVPSGFDTPTVELPGIGWSLDNNTCTEALYAADGQNVDEFGVVDLAAGPPTLTQIASTGINISRWYHPDIGSFPSVGSVTSCNFCGDGVLDVGEECDDGGVDPGDGCSAACLIESGFQCSGEPSVCEPIPADTCGDGVRDVGEECDDGNVADGDCCTSSCTLPICDTSWGKGKLVVNEKRAGKEKLIAKLLKGPAMGQTDLGDPSIPAGSAYHLCVLDDENQLVTTLRVDRAGDTCGTKPCWGSIGDDPPSGKGYVYKDKESGSDGVSLIKMKANPKPDKSLILVKGKNNSKKGQESLPTGLVSALGDSSSVTIQLASPDFAQCHGITLSEVSVKNGVLKAK